LFFLGHVSSIQCDRLLAGTLADRCSK